MALISHIIAHLLWLFLYGCVNLVQSITWLINGNTCQLRRNRTEGAYKRTAHVRKVLCRHKLDLLCQPSGLNNFITMHRGFRDPEYVLSPNVTLYNITPTEAIFVESERNVDVTKSRYSPFLRVAQFEYAVNIVVLPMHVFLKLAQKLDVKNRGHIFFVSMTSRCGSSLLTQIFEERGDTISLAEPDAIAELLAFQDRDFLIRFDTLITCVVNIMCKPAGPNINYLVKLAPQVTPLVPDLIRVFPEAKQMFMYRRGLEMCESLSRAVQEMPLIRLLSAIGRCVPCLCKFVLAKKNLPMFGEYFDDVVSSRMGFSCYIWGQNIKQYTEMRNDNFPVVGVRYEDMLADIFHASNAIFQYCNVTTDREAVSTAFGRDSQKGTPVDRQKLSRHSPETLTPALNDQLDNMCRRMGVPLICSTCLLAGTITSKTLTEEGSGAPSQVFVCVQ